jgi:S1-C subfamily serine protease
MQKKHAIDLLGGTVAKAADAIGINSQAISQWPEDLPPRLADRVIAACLRTGVRIPPGWLSQPVAGEKA